jgi:hypothetical protein
MVLAVGYRSMPFLVQSVHAGGRLDEIVTDDFMQERWRIVGERSAGDLNHVR